MNSGRVSLLTKNRPFPLKTTVASSSQRTVYSSQTCLYWSTAVLYFFCQLAKSSAYCASSFRFFSAAAAAAAASAGVGVREVEGVLRAASRLASSNWSSRSCMFRR